jgi:GTP-binding protein
MKRFGADEDLLSYCTEAEEWEATEKDKPLFVLPISAVAHINCDALRYALGFFIDRAKRLEDGTRVTEQK